MFSQMSVCPGGLGGTPASGPKSFAGGVPSSSVSGPVQSPVPHPVQWGRGVNPVSMSG